MNITVSNKPNTQQISVAPQQAQVHPTAMPHPNWGPIPLLYSAPHSPYNPPTVPVKGGVAPMPALNPQANLPLFLMRGGEDIQGSFRQLQPQPRQPANFNPWMWPVNPLTKPLRTILI